MQVFKAFFLSLKRQYKSTLIYMFVFAMIQVILVHSVSQESYGDYTATQVSIAVFDHDNSEESEALYEYLNDTQNIVSIKEDDDSMADELFNRNVDYILIIPEGFSQDFTTLENIKQPNSSSGYFMDTKIDQFVKILETYQLSGYSTADAIELTNETLSQEAEVITYSDNGADTSKPLISYYFQYLPYMFLTLLVTSLGSVLCIFRKKDLSARIQCSTLSITKRNIQMALSCCSFGLIILLMFLVLGAVICSQNFFEMKTLLFVLNAFLNMLFGLAFTLLISYFAPTDTVLNLIANLISLGLCFLGGVFVPLDLLSGSVKAVGKFLPTYWYILSNNLITTFDGSTTQLSTLSGYMGIQILFIVAMFAIALVASKAKKSA